MDSSSTPSIPIPDSSTINPQSICQKADPAWSYVTMAQSSDGKKLLICNFYEKVIKRGGINRMKMHLAGQSGDVARCEKVSNDVCFRLNESLKKIAQQKLERLMNHEEGSPFKSFSLEQEFRRHNEGISIKEDDSINSNAKSSSGKRKANSGITSYFPQGTVPGAQPSIKAKLQSPEK